MNFNDYTQFKDPCIKYPIENLDLPFDDYIAECRRIIQTYRLDLNANPHPNSIINANTPYELPPLTENKNRVGALLIHGLFDCPFIMRDTGNYLQQQGMLVRSILLPGHGTVPGALLHVKYTEWIQTVLYGITSLAKEVDQIVLVGFSTGASLALHHAFSNLHPKIKALILLAPAIQISSLGPLTWLPSKLSFLSERFNWLSVANENDYTKYQSHTFNSAYQVYLLTQEIYKLSEATFLKCPVFICISADDGTVISKATLKHFRLYSSKESRLILYTNKPNDIHDTRIIKRPAAYPESHIKSISHVAIPISPMNSHYGKNGDYSGASHIEENIAKNKKIVYCAWNNVTADWANWLHEAGLYSHSYQKLSFNPDFDFLITSLDKFIKKVTSSY